ncbi:MAG: hypothetical protein JO267_10675 [Alphaproteobacteria bacterium]|nr:hypothetical protein [Alphaproteobacteria bacterium]
MRARPIRAFCRRVALGTRLLALAATAGSLAACLAAKPFLIQGDASSAEVGYSGDVAGATAVARQHCAQYERVPRLLEAERDIAFFDCVKP